jgi:hypothetical protein
MEAVTTPTDEDIKTLLRKHGVTREQAAALLFVSQHTIDSWCAPITSRKHNDMPLSSWELLLLKLDEHPLKVAIDR